MSVATVIWSGYIDHPSRPELPCRVIIRGTCVNVEMDWGAGWTSSHCSSDYYTITAAAFRDIAAGAVRGPTPRDSSP